MRNIHQTAKWAASLLITSLITLPAAYALPLAPEDMPTNWVLDMGVTPSTAAFYPGSNTYFSTSRGTGGIYASSGPFLALTTDVVGTTMISAKVSSTGELEDGTFVWVGSSENLGIATGTTLLSATITDVHWDPSNSFLFQFRARVDFVSPALRSATGPVKSLLIYDYVHMSDDFFNNPWTASFFGEGPTTSPGVWMAPTVLPLTWDELNASFFVAASDAPLSSYDSTTNIYSMVGELGSESAPAVIREYPDSFSVIANDAVGNFNLAATIDENGVVSSGSASWEGVIASLGLIPGVPLLDGTISEVMFMPDGPRFDFLITVDYIHPLLEAAVGSVETLIVSDYQDPGMAFYANPWNASFFDMAYTTGPGVAGSPETMMNSDTDGDGIADATDNCTNTSNVNQRDTNGDGYGNFCDPDLNDDGVVNFTDIALWIPFFNSATTGDADFNGDGVASFGDYALYPQYFLKPPGPSQVTPAILSGEKQANR